jgi:hypothetical protein
MLFWYLKEINIFSRENYNEFSFMNFPRKFFIFLPSSGNILLLLRIKNRVNNVYGNDEIFISMVDGRFSWILILCWYFQEDFHSFITDCIQFGLNFFWVYPLFEWTMNQKISLWGSVTYYAWRGLIGSESKS